VGKGGAFSIAGEHRRHPVNGTVVEKRRFSGVLYRAQETQPLQMPLQRLANGTTVEKTAKPFLTSAY